MEGNFMSDENNINKMNNSIAIMHFVTFVEGNQKIRQALLNYCLQIENRKIQLDIEDIFNFK